MRIASLPPAQRVRLLGLQPQLLLGLIILDGVIQSITGLELQITSISDGKHKRKSLHFKGFGGDARSREFTKEQQEEILQAGKIALGPEFDLVLEKDHFHIEWDPED